MYQKGMIAGVVVVVGIALAVWGAGLVNPPAPVETAPSIITYENTEFGFVFDYPTAMEAKSREPGVQDTTVAGLNTKFFLSLRDTVRDEKPLTLARFHAIENTTLEQYTAALIASDPGNISIISTEDLDQNGLAMKKVKSTTAIGFEKTQYLFWKDTTLILIEVTLQEDAAFDPVFATLRAF